MGKESRRKRQKRDEIGSKSSGDSWGANPDCTLPPPPAMAPNAMGFPHYIDIAGAAFSACAAPIKEITSHTASRPSCCVSISFRTERRRRMGAALRFMSSARINERKTRMKESDGPDPPQIAATRLKQSADRMRPGNPPIYS
jgi:hypothetical protein